MTGAEGLIRVLVSGAAGRLGRRILALVHRDPELELRGALVRRGSAHDGRDLGGEVGEPGLSVRASSATDGIEAGVVLIEVAPKGPALEHARLAAERGAALVLASTGFDPKERAELETLAASTPLLLAPNLSLGVAVLTDLVRRASAALAAYDLELVELHHRRKRDAPSGTAWALARVAAEARSQDIDRTAILARAGEIGPRGTAEFGLQSVRGGDIIGEHTLYLVGETERLELTHRAQTRDVFAAGAVAAAKFMGTADRKPGLYSMRDVLGLDDGPRS